MSEVEMTRGKGGVACCECPYCTISWWLPRLLGAAPRCGHPRMRHPVTGRPWQTCDEVRGCAHMGQGGKPIDGTLRLVCAGYFPEEHAVRWRGER